MATTAALSLYSLITSGESNFNKMLINWWTGMPKRPQISTPGAYDVSEDELTVQVWLLYGRKNFKCSTLCRWNRFMDWQIDRWTILLLDVLVDLSVKGHKNISKEYNVLPS